MTTATHDPNDFSDVWPDETYFAEFTTPQEQSQVAIYGAAEALAYLSQAYGGFFRELAPQAEAHPALAAVALHVAGIAIEAGAYRQTIDWDWDFAGRFHTDGFAFENIRPLVERFQAGVAPEVRAALREAETDMSLAPEVRAAATTCQVFLNARSHSIAVPPYAPTLSAGEEFSDGDREGRRAAADHLQRVGVVETQVEHAEPSHEL